MRTFIDNEAKRIQVLDERFYLSKKLENTYYPSVTTILEVYPKGFYFEQFLKSQGENADILKNNAGQRGTTVHEMIESFLKGQKIRFGKDENNLSAQYSLDEWQMFERFIEFYSTVKPEIETLEFPFASDTYKYGGTIDCICIINGKRWLIDWKTSNAIYPSYELQLSAYAMAWNDLHSKDKIDNVGILWLNAKTRGADKTGKKIQGANWQLVTFDRSYTDAFSIFNHVKCIWDEENPTFKPRTFTMKTEYSLDDFQM